MASGDGSNAVEETGTVTRRWGMSSYVRRADTRLVEEEDAVLPDSAQKSMTENRTCACAKIRISLRDWLT